MLFIVWNLQENKSFYWCFLLLFIVGPSRFDSVINLLFAHSGSCDKRNSNFASSEQRKADHSVDYHVLKVKKYFSDFPHFHSLFEYHEKCASVFKIMSVFHQWRGGSSAFTPPIMLFARPVTLQAIVPVTWSFVPLAGATLYHIWRGLAEPLSSLHLPLNTLFVCVSPREWTIVPHPKGTETKSLVFQFPWCLISPCDKFMRFNCTMVF